MGNPPKKKGPPRKTAPPKEDGTSDDDEPQNSDRKSCPICGHGNYKYARGVHNHIRKKHPHYKQLYEMKTKISEACRHEKRRCPNCNSLQANLSR